MILLLLLLLKQCVALDLYVASNTNTVFTNPNLICDGVDDNIEIQNALNQIKTAGGGNLYLSNGLFNIKTTINIYENTNLIGANIDNTILKLSDNAPKFTKAGLLRCYLQNNIAFKQFTIDGNRANQATDSNTNYGRYGIYSESCNNTLMDSLHVKNWYGYGLDPHGVGGTSIPSTYVTITNNNIHDNGWDGIAVDKCEDSIVAFNNIYNNGRHGINVCTGSKRVDVHDNTLNYNGFNYEGTLNGCGIMVQNNQGYITSDISLLKNDIKTSQKGAICLDDVFNLVISNNIISNTQICLRIKNIPSMININIGINVCDGTRALYSETAYSGPTPSFLPTISPKSEYIVSSATSGMLGDLKCNGVNDEEEINKAIMYVAFNGGTVTLSDGDFNIGMNIFLTSNLILRGQGRDLTRIMLTNNGPTWKYAGMIRGFDIINTIIKDLTLDGNRLNQVNDQKYNYGKYGFYCEVCNNIKFDNIVSRNHWGYGIDPHGTPGESFYSDGFIITNSLIEQNGWDGITIDKTLNTVIQNNVIQNNGRHGINIVTGSKNVQIVGNTLNNNGWFYYTGSSGCGIMLQNNGLFGTSNIDILTNTIQLSKSSGICINDIDSTKFVSNTINGASSCMKFTSSDTVYLESNICSAAKKINVGGTYTQSTYTIVNQNNVVFA
jgi:parallel beta-helix repeat protein